VDGKRREREREREREEGKEEKRQNCRGHGAEAAGCRF